MDAGRQKTSLHFLQREARAGENVEHVLADWLAWLFCFLPLAHTVRIMDCYLMEGEKVRPLANRSSALPIAIITSIGRNPERNSLYI